MHPVRWPSRCVPGSVAAAFYAVSGHTGTGTASRWSRSHWGALGAPCVQLRINRPACFYFKTAMCMYMYICMQQPQYKEPILHSTFHCRFPAPALSTHASTKDALFSARIQRISRRFSRIRGNTQSVCGFTQVPWISSPYEAICSVHHAQSGVRRNHTFTHIL